MLWCHSSKTRCSVQRRHHGGRQQHVAGCDDQHKTIRRGHCRGQCVAFAQQLGRVRQACTAVLFPDGRAYQRKGHLAKLPRLRLVMRPVRQADVERGTQDFPVFIKNVASNARGGLGIASRSFRSGLLAEGAVKPARSLPGWHSSIPCLCDLHASIGVTSDSVRAFVRHAIQSATACGAAIFQRCSGIASVSRVQRIRVVLPLPSTSARFTSDTLRRRARSCRTSP